MVSGALRVIPTSTWPRAKKQPIKAVVLQAKYSTIALVMS
jgi:hypothetical protein